MRGLVSRITSTTGATAWRDTPSSPSGKPRAIRSLTPRVRVASSLSVAREAGVPRVARSPSVRSATPTRSPRRAASARAPPQPISASSGWAEKARTSSGSTSAPQEITHHQAVRHQTGALRGAGGKALGHEHRDRLLVEGFAQDPVQHHAVDRTALTRNHSTRQVIDERGQQYVGGPP